MFVRMFLTRVLKVPAHELDNYIEVHRGDSDVTVFAFAGALGLYSLAPAFEFRKLLHSTGQKYNLVFLRDFHRCFYHLTPKGEPGGLDFYADKIKELVATLGSTHNVALGISMGGTAAVEFGARCGLDQVIAFNPCFPIPRECRLRNNWPAFVNLPQALFRPGKYLHVTQLAVAMGGLYRRLRSLVPAGEISTGLEPYLDDRPVPRTTILYGGGNCLDKRHARLLAGSPRVDFVEAPTSSHNTARFLKLRGELAGVVTDLISQCRALKKVAGRRLHAQQPVGVSAGA
jgi:hypothetical protein